MKTRPAIFIILLLFVSNFSFGQTIKIPNGFKLGKGVNFAMWLSQSDKRGAEREKYITETDFKNVASLGFDHIRLPIDEVQFWDENGVKHPEAFKLMHNAIGWALKNNLRVIVDLHIIRSHYFNAASNPLWDDPKEQDKLVSLWQQLSGELHKYPNNFVAYELLNEAVAEDHDEWNKLIAKLVRALRETEPERAIVIGSNKWQGPETFPYLKVPGNDKNIILSFHFYRPFALTHYTAPWTAMKDYHGPVYYPGEVVHKKDLEGYPGQLKKNIAWALGKWDKNALIREMEPAIKTAKKLGLPLYCGEFGVYPPAPKDAATRWYRDMVSAFKENNIAFAHWEYKGGFPIVDKNLKPLQPLVDILTK